MSLLNVTEILGKIDELRAVFLLGQRGMPFLEEIFSFIQEIAPLMGEINQSLEDTTGKMPQARSQLESVTQATELATTEIMDLVDEVQALVRTNKAALNAATEALEEMRNLDQRLLTTLRDGLGADHEVLVAAEALFEAKDATRYQATAALRAEAEGTDQMRDSLNQIMMSLQVQDITTQQIASVTHLIESIRNRMASLNERLGMTGPTAAAPFKATNSLDQGDTFDVHARYVHDPGRQAGADEVVSQYADDAPDDAGDAVSPDDIDALFGGDTPDAAGAKPTSQDDIDALFGDGATDAAGAEPASQDDIDALFGG